MKKTIFRAQAIFVLGCLLAGASPGKTNMASSSASNDTVTAPFDQKFSDDELDELLAPIALYPDPLLAQLVPASTFVDQLIEADRVLGGKSDDNLIANQSWDVSVKSVAHYPQVLQMMVQKSDWTTTLGQAYVNQSTDVAKSIQRLRAEAKAAGNLVTTSQQEVITEGQVIRIEPAQPQVIYVPQYNPQVVYVNSGPSTGALIAFGTGLVIGAWLNNDWDYYGRGIYYHGWVGGGWVGRNRTYINVNRNVYINNRYRNVNVNRTVVNRNTSSYRTNLTRNANVRRERVNANRRDVNTGNRRDNNAGDRANRANAGRSDALRNRDQNREKLDPGRARDARNTANRRDANSSAFGGDGNRRQVKQESARGGQSVQRMKANPQNAGGGGRSKPSAGGGGGRSKPSGGGGRERRG